MEPWPDFYPQATYMLVHNVCALNSFTNLLTYLLPNLFSELLLQ